MQREAFVVSQPNHRALRALNYTPAVEALRRARGSKTVIPVGDAVSELGLGYATVFARIACEPEHGVEFLSQSDMFAAEPVGRWIRRDSMNKPERHEVRRWQILIAGAGTLGENELYGRPVIADGRLAGKYVGQDTLVLAFDPPGSDLNLYLYAFLASPTGLKALRSASYGTKILRIRKDMLRELPIPSADNATISRVASLIRDSVEQREKYSRELSEARGILEAIPEMREALEMCGKRRARCIVWPGALQSLAAWNVASAGEALGYLRRRWPSVLSEQTVKDGIFFGNLRKRFPCDPGYGFQLISQRDLHQVRPFPVWIQSPSTDHATVFSAPGSIAMAGEGTTGEGDSLGRPVFINARMSSYALTEHILRIVPRREFGASLHTFLSTLVGRRLVLTAASGTIVQKLRRDLIAELPVPTLDSLGRRTLATHHDAAYVALDRSVAAENAAVRIIEDEVLPQWLA